MSVSEGDRLGLIEHSDECERHHVEHLNDPEPGAADCICSVDSGDPEDDDEVTRLRRQLAGAVEAERARITAEINRRLAPPSRRHSLDGGLRVALEIIAGGRR